MRSFVEQSREARKLTSTGSPPQPTYIGRSRDPNMVARASNAIEEQPERAAASGFGHDFSRIPARADAGGRLPGMSRHRGLNPDAGENELVRGRTAGEFIGDVARPVGTFLGNAFGSVVGALTGISVSSTTNTGPTFSDNGALDWQIAFSTTGRNGWLVQEIANGWRAEDSAGAAVANPFTPHYWEAWAVDGAGAVTPSVSAANDFWTNPNLNTAFGAAKGHWTTTGKVHFTTTDPATQGFTRNNPATNAGVLLSSTSGPSGLGITRLHRYAQGTWDSSNPSPNHSGSAGP
ncbi:MAG: hypothetical protein JWQ98_550 [Chlorobi bacterium]|nr:hypothetical protein [Chlorobiota bacterium]